MFSILLVKVINEGVSLIQMSKLNKKVLSPLSRVVKKNVIVILVLQ